MRLLALLGWLLMIQCPRQSSIEVSEDRMKEVYETVKTPFKYGVVFKHPDSTKMMDSPTIFRWENTWFMTYIIFDGRGYETWIAKSDDLLNWNSQGRILSFTDSGWDANQKAGYLGLLDNRWEGSYAPQTHDGKFWMSYLGGSAKGYEAGQLGIGMAHAKNPIQQTDWSRFPEPVLSASDKDARWYDNHTIFKSLIIADPDKKRGYPFLIFYNSSGDTAKYESIAMAGSHDLQKWNRLGNAPIISRGVNGSICGDAQVMQLGDLYVMFYFGAFWPDRKAAFERFACSYDLEHWTEWTGPSLIEPSELYDSEFAHKPMVINWNNTVYHFYNAVGKEGRVIALASSKQLN
jgi:predicted GH43/DUF377 family glycosyl hydrolase